MKLLFIGNSHTFVHSMPGIVKRIMEENDVDVHVTMLTRGGMNFKYHVENEQTKFNILYGDYDYVILQNCAHPMEDFEVMKEYGLKLIEWCNQANTTPILYQTWTAKKDGPSLQKVMSQTYQTLADLTDTTIAPVGDYWWQYHHAYPEDELYYKDGEHTSIIGATLAAYVISKTILNKTLKATDETDLKILSVIQ